MNATSGTLREVRAERLLAVSDLHVDYDRNRRWVEDLVSTDHSDAALIVAGDVSHRLDRMESTLASLASAFAAVFFVPGNHDLWTGEGSRDSLHKLEQLESICGAVGVLTESAILSSGGAKVQVIPLYSWYHEPEESGDSLFIGRNDEDPWREIWADYRRVRWPGEIAAGGVADLLGAVNARWTREDRRIPVVTFSHFLPRQELLRGNPGSLVNGSIEPRHAFNFSRVAGSASIDRQLRSLESRVHVYGHQHRNRDRIIDRVRYRSHCLGYPSERDKRHITKLEDGPIVIWKAADGLDLKEKTTFGVAAA
ncbi:MAG: metallophosphoesterase [Opitutaceae bacterium]